MKVLHSPRCSLFSSSCWPSFGRQNKSWIWESTIEAWCRTCESLLKGFPSPFSKGWWTHHVRGFSSGVTRAWACFLRWFWSIDCSWSQTSEHSLATSACWRTVKGCDLSPKTQVVWRSGTKKAFHPGVPWQAAVGFRWAVQRNASDKRMPWKTSP